MPSSWAGCFGRGPDSLAHYELRGARGPACLRVLLAADVSGSMADFRRPRNAALSELLAWLPRNLRPDDEVGVMEFAGNAAWTRSPESVTRLQAFDPAQIDLQGTRLSPVLDLVGQLPQSRCATSLLLLSDGKASDLPAGESQGLDALGSSHVHDLHLLVPGRRIGIPGAWRQAFPASPPLRFDGSDPEKTAMTFGAILSTATGQRLVRS